jgi:hypothetical protein
METRCVHRSNFAGSGSPVGTLRGVLGLPVPLSPIGALGPIIGPFRRFSKAGGASVEPACDQEQTAVPAVAVVGIGCFRRWVGGVQAPAS